MSKKGLIFIIVSMLLLTTFPNINAVADDPCNITITNLKITSEELKDHITKYSNDNNTTEIGFATIGPNLLRFRRITFQNGSLFDIIRMKYILRRNILPRLLPWTHVFTYNGDLDFTVEYIKDNPMENMSSKFYFTMYEDNVTGNITNETIIWHKRHTIKVEDFYGDFTVFNRILTRPPSYLIVGCCKKLTITYPE